MGLAQSGDTGAFDALVALYQDRIFALAYRMLGDTEDASDVQQETFVRAWRSLRKFRADSAFSTWLHKIAMNLCLSRKQRKRAYDTIPFDEDMPSSQGSVACIEKTQVKTDVQKIIAGLPAHYRALIVLREIEGRSFEEIAQILGCSAASARTRTSKARAILRERLWPYLTEEDL